jgi:hypothetical protein
VGKDGNSALGVARAYHGAWTNGLFDQASPYLAENPIIETPINTFPTKESWIAAVTMTAKMASGVEVLSNLGGDGEGVLIYDLTMPFGVMRVAEHFTLRDKTITRIRQIHDTHSLRASAAAAALSR